MKRKYVRKDVINTTEIVVVIRADNLETLNSGGWSKLKTLSDENFCKSDKSKTKRQLLQSSYIIRRYLLLPVNT